MNRILKTTVKCNIVHFNLDSRSVKDIYFTTTSVISIKEGTDLSI